MAKSVTVEVSRRALVGRLERSLRRQGRKLAADRRGQIMRHIVIDVEKQTIVDTGVNLEKLGRKLLVLRPWERMAKP